MKYNLIILTLVFLFVCAQGQQYNQAASNSAQLNKDSSSNDKLLIKADSKKVNSLNEYLTSTYDNPEFTGKLINHRKTLKKLSDEKVFSVINNNLIQTLTEKQQQYFKTKIEFELLTVAKGDLFQEKKEDNAFVVYDKKNQRISILLYNDMADKYAELYRDIKVENGLKDADCNYGAFGTLDYQLASEIIYQEDYLLKKPENYLETSPCKIVNISKDKDFILDRGCFSKKVSKSNLSNSLCIATSCVYNNWECMKYYKATNSFLIYYGQAFAD